MSKQTAVEWYENEINALIQKYENQEISKSDFIVMKHNLFYPAKAMEKEQIVDAANKLLYHNTGPGDTAAEQYYNETYGGDK